ncbi:transferase hexapeptide repeat containing protein [Gloeocapsa sp. PCC 7428]|uniref:acyltransferase n=1 Tax=Gloeocapsa sp. PCC 7428 TaxID=1173026 RepID=UPI0002A604E9|nr:acyltransferase [Gloeocapsa sp. PCC 7428]AFZ29506.1 transferase hexapeptide repeat containing protein [Gloeocapsa sp. PCC 7428]
MDISEFIGTWDYASLLPANVRIGKDCYLERKDSFQRFRSRHNPGLVLGNGVYVYTWTVFSVEPEGVVVVGDESILVGAMFWCAQSITIGKRVTISYNVTIADSDFHPRKPGLRRQDAIAIAPPGDQKPRPSLVTQPVIVEDDVQIGIGAMILKGVHIGAGAQIGAGSVVTANVPAQAVVAGNPARIQNQALL